MKLTYSIRTATRGLFTHKSRTALTILGIVIGITAIILIASLGKAAQNLVLGQLQSLGSNIVVVVPGKEPKGPTDPSVADSLFSDSLKERELEAIENKANVPKVSSVMPVVFGSDSVAYGGETYRPMILGTSELIADIFDLFPESGTFFTNDDIESKARVVVIGTDVKNELFGQSDAVGEKIKVKNQDFRVIGVLPPKGQVLIFNFDKIVITPYTSAQQYIFGTKYFNRLIVQADNDEDVPQTVSDIEDTLRVLHGITDPSEDDFFVVTQEGISDTLSTVTGTITLFLSSVAAIALLVGGIGIMNIMLVSATERRKEIGLRKALGATNRHILVQFLIESITLTGIGGIIGIIFGTLLAIGASTALTFFMNIPWAFSFPTGAAVIGFLVSAFVGLVFGIYPARKASLKSPVEAMFYD